jgi:iron complex outermembrane recepter protein
VLSYVGLLLLCIPVVAEAQDPPTPAQEKQERERLVDLTIEDLMDVSMTTPAKKEQRLLDVPAAVAVVRGDDIRRMGVRTIPDSLRPVPGLHVAKIDANKWIVTSRGFSNRFANKLEVLFDGRTVYSPLFSGVLWETQDPMIEDIDRIEVIRGPGASVWGSNAMNGVINIISKDAKDTQGALITGGVGTEERAFAAARCGFSSGPDFHARVFAKADDRDRAFKGRDAWVQARAGFRADWTPGDADKLTFMGDYYDGQFHGLVTVPQLTAPFSTTFSNTLDNSGGYVTARWERTFSPTAQLTTQLSYERTVRSDELLPADIRDTVELDVTHRFCPLQGHDFIWGAGYRASRDRLEGSFTISFDPEQDRKGLASFFLQDDIAIVEQRLKMTLGSRFEYNQYTGFEVQPGVRLVWTPDEPLAFWAAVTRAVRMPSRAENDIRLNQTVLPGPPPVILRLVGDRDFRSEELLAFEIGHRIRPVDPLSADLALFYNVYDKLRTTDPRAPFAETSPPPPHGVLPFAVDNNLSGRTCGAELAVTWKPVATVSLHAAYTLLRMHLDLENGSTDTLSEDAERNSPRQQVFVRASVDLSAGFEFDLMGRWVESLPGMHVNSYIEADARLGWRATEMIDVAVVGQNLVHDHHFEAGTTILGNQASEVERGVYFTVSVRF